MTTQPAVLSPWDVAMNPPKPVSEWYGQMTVNAWFCALIKGQGKVAWNPNVLDANGNPARRYTCIDLSLTPITETPFANNIERNMLAEFGEWIDIVLPSMKALGVTNLQQLSGMWARCEMVSTGRSYTNKNGETQDATTFKLLQVFQNEAECRAAYTAARGGNGNGGGINAQYQAAQAAPWTPPTNGANSGQQATALKFLKPYVHNAWINSGKDLDKARALLVTAIAGQKLLSDYFTVDSPEVLDLLMQEAAV